MTQFGWLLVLWGLLLAPCARAQPPSLTPTYWQQRLFYIPYQVNQRGKLLDPIAKVQLLYSRTGVNDWETLEEAQPNVQGFSYHAPEDGEYWFALRHLDRRGRPWPSAGVQPQMRLVVDTVQPELKLDGSMDPTGEITIRYEARDVNLQPESLVLEAQDARGRWSQLQVGAPDISQADRLLGRAQWRTTDNRSSVKLRAAIADKAGYRAVVEKDVATGAANPPGLDRLSPEGPSLNSAQAAVKKLTDPFTRTSKLPSRDWPASNRLPVPPVNPPLAFQQAPPTTNPYTAAKDETWPARTPAKLVGEAANPTLRSLGADAAPQTLSITPLGADNAPAEQPESTPWQSPEPLSVENGNTHQEWTAARSNADSASLVVNSRTFDVEYDLQAVGPWGVSKVELWGTVDEGRTWRSFGVDPDNRSPIRVTVPSAGQFGFRILVDGANSAGSPPPHPGEAPELTVSVDLHPPTVKLLAADLGQGNLSGHLVVGWKAADTNLEQRPIALFYSSYPNGPWSTIASGLENTGSYTWRIERHVPGRFYLRLEARDVAGNLATFQTPSPIELARPQPTGKLRNVRPIDGE